MQNCNEDCWWVIFGLSDVKTIINLMSVNIFYYKAAKKNFLWNKLCLKNSFPTNVNHDQYINYKKCYIISKWCVNQGLTFSSKNIFSVAHLDLSNKKIFSIPPELGILNNLRILKLGNNNLTSIPPELGNLSKLEELSFFNNRLTSIPPELGNLSNLKRLYLGDNNNLTSIPPWKFNLDIRY